MIKKFVGDKAFYKMTLSVALPIMLQNFITNFVSMLDNLMVGSLGTEQMSGVSIVNQLIFVFNLAIFGALSGAGIFTAQYYGKGDNDGIRYTVRFKVLISLAIFVVGAAIFAVFDSPLINLFMHDVDPTCDLEATVSFAKDYLRVILWGLLPFALSQCFSSTLRETGETFAPMLAGFSAVVVNCVFNYLLIFGKFGFPELGVEGAAIATVLSRYVECAAIMLYAFIKRKRFSYIKGAFKSLYIPKRVLGNITVKGMPLLVNEFLWSSGMTLLSVAYSLHGLSVVAGYSISSTVMNLSNIAFMALGSSIGIIVGKQLGSGDFEEAVDTDRKLIAFSVFLSVVTGIVVFLLGGKIPELYKTSEASRAYATYFIRACACFLPVDAFAHASYFTIRSGGKTFVTFLFDSVFVLCVSVPVAFLLYYVGHLSIYIIFPVVLAANILKDVVGFILLKKRVWVNNIV